MHHRLKHPAFVSTLLKNPCRGAEIGVERGHFTAYLLQKYPDLHMLAVDPWQTLAPFEDWPMEEIIDEFEQRTAPYQQRLTVLRMESVEAAPIVADASLDFVFIDAEHSYRSVLQDIAAWQPKVRPGGLLMGHDFSPKYPGVQRAVSEVFPYAEVDTFSRVWWVTC